MKRKSSLIRDIEAWETDGGAALTQLGDKAQVASEFDRVTASFRSIATKQGADRRADTEGIIAIVEDKRSEVMSRVQAGYFIRDWQEISDQVRQLVFHDPRYQSIKSSTAARRR